LTFKSPLADCDHEFKKMKELKVEVSDFDAMNHILQALGLQKEYASCLGLRWRKRFLLNCLDVICL
jgi:adenylate cyclase class IV